MHEGDVYFVFVAARSLIEQRAETRFKNDDEFIVVFSMDGLTRRYVVLYRRYVQHCTKSARPLLVPLSHLRVRAGNLTLFGLGKLGA